MTAGRTAVALFLVLVAVYNANGTVLLGNDATANYFAAVSLVKRGDLDLDEYPQLRNAQGGVPYFLTEAGGHLISRLGPGTPVAVAPLFAVAVALGHGKVNERTALYLAKAASSAFVAAAAALLFLLALQLGASRRQAILAALLYGLTTCAFGVVSQSLWQHGPSEFFGVLGWWLLGRGGRRSIAFAGAAFAAMVACRPPNLVFALAATGYVAQKHRRELGWFLLAALPLAIALGAYNTYYLGAPWRSAQMVHVVGEGPRASYWSGNPLVGFAGLLVSPSRGLFVYSPFFLFLLWRPRALWRETPLLVRWALGGVALLIALVSPYYGWYGGWNFGYRMIVDASPILVLALLPVLRWIGGWTRGLFVAAVLVSVLIQAVGAYCYTPPDWDGHPDVDVHRDRLWSLRDSQLVYWLTHPSLRARP